ncbi:MAG TPA: hypothetical protein VF857_06710 [Spirochaetota bacterium]
MFDLIRARWRHGYQAVKNIRGAQVDEKFRGFPLISEDAVINADELSFLCPSGGCTAQPVSIDLGRCTFCNACIRASNGKIRFTNFHHTAAFSREDLIIRSGMTPEEFSERKAEKISKKIRSMFGRSLKLRSVSAGGCNACELELNACGNVNFDMGRFGIDIVASPRHADGIVITGPVSENMAGALMDTYNAIPHPKLVIAVGSCAISGGIFEKSPAIDRSFFNEHKVDLFVPGCPPHPLTMVNGILDLMGRK